MQALDSAYADVLEARKRMHHDDLVTLKAALESKAAEAERLRQQLQGDGQHGQCFQETTEAACLDGDDQEDRNALEADCASLQTNPLQDAASDAGSIWVLSSEDGETARPLSHR
ncbi:unnamed protein product [Symbiodinium pilosum]|uniref:Uncharacterized protein n=1 Tax=Symbiodinium pilosum TaxID=2952 RepID=A0A812LRH3_SYMPI|nr:unnamed protein product [Symbiodinium pilosum]